MRFFLLFLALIFTASCSRPDFDPSVQVDDWLKDLDPDAEVIEVWCTYNIEESPGSGIWKEETFKHQFSVREVRGSAANRGLDWPAIVAHMIEATRGDFPRWVAVERMLFGSKELLFRMSFRPEDVHCDGKPLRSPMIQIGKCPNDTHGCDEPPMPTDLPPLPSPPPGGGGDY